MAKNTEVGFVESHIEKVVLGACALLLAIVAIYWLPSSPRRVSVLARTGAGVTELPPDQADAELQAAAAEIRKRANQVAPPEYDAVNFLARVHTAAAMPFTVEPMKEVATLGGRSVVVDANNRVEVTPVTTADLQAALPAPGKPGGWRDLEMSKPVTGQPLIEKVTFHGTALYPWSELRNNLEPKLRAVAPLPLVMGVEVQVREMLPAGAGPEQPARLVGAAPLPKISDFTGVNGAALGAELAEVVKKQYRALVADYPDVYDPASKGFVKWTAHLALPGDANADKFLARTQPSDKSMTILDLTKQITEGSLVIAFHDNSLQMDRGYSYRLRLVFSNPLLGMNSASLKEPKDATTKEMRTEWSEWSDTVLVRNPTEFFIVPRSAGTVEAIVFTRKLGHLVGLRNYVLEPGRTIGKPVLLSLPNPLGGANIETEVDFSTSCIAIEPEERVTVRQNLLGNVKTSTMALLLLNEKGELEWRLSDESAKKRVEELSKKVSAWADGK